MLIPIQEIDSIHPERELVLLSPAPAQTDGIAEGKLESRLLLRRRIFAFMVDSFVLQGFCLYIARFVSLSMLASHGRELVGLNGAHGADLFFAAYQYGFLCAWGGISVLATGAYFYVAFTHFGKSLGTGLLGLQLVNAAGTRPTRDEAGLRAVGILLTGLSLGLPFLAYYFGIRKHSWHDSWSGTFLKVE